MGLSTRKQNMGETILEIPSSLCQTSYDECRNTDNTFMYFEKKSWKESLNSDGQQFQLCQQNVNMFRDYRHSNMIVKMKHLFNGELHVCKAITIMKHLFNGELHVCKAITIRIFLHTFHVWTVYIHLVFKQFLFFSLPNKIGEETSWNSTSLFCI